MTTSAASEKPWGDYVFFISSNHDVLTAVEMKTLQKTVDWTKAYACLGVPSGMGKTGAMLRLLRQLREELCADKCAERHDDRREDLRALLTRQKDVKTRIAVYYLKLMALRPLLRMQVLLRQKLANSAPVARLFLRNRTRHILATHPSVAPPKAA